MIYPIPRVRPDRIRDQYLADALPKVTFSVAVFTTEMPSAIFPSVPLALDDSIIA
ncbi:hypothetical protein D3C78_1775220 [compost metagenome]